MAYDPGAIEAALAAAVGDEPGLIAELRLAFHDSADRALNALTQAGDEPAWREACWRLKGLAASFGAVRLMVLASDAADQPPGDAVSLRRLRRAVERLA
ncbi:MAG TPA: Hpt domain-containing protein [Sphingomonas sp.]|jgi:HPt (histidine-containing phosphotransfer) domain-containing protein|uniref:Hpt domain-containing protein n=1 Tax=Sphingomonas sp. TaxID=28214 RepID=UPI002EDABEF8